MAYKATEFSFLNAVEVACVWLRTFGVCRDFYVCYKRSSDAQSRPLRTPLSKDTFSSSLVFGGEERRALLVLISRPVRRVVLLADLRDFVFSNMLGWAPCYRINNGQCLTLKAHKIEEILL